MKIILQTTRSFIREGHCCLCGETFDWEEFVALVEDSKQPNWQRRVCCPTCLAAGPSGIKERALRAAEHQMEWAKQDLADAQALQSEEITFPTTADYEAVAAEIEADHAARH